MHKHKILPFTIIVTIVAMLLIACGPATPEATEAPTKATEAPAEPTEAAPTEAPTEAAPEATEEVPAAPTCPPSTVADSMGLEGEWPQQWELAEFEGLADCKLTFSENPLFAGQGLPPVEERLPAELLVVQPYDEIGAYGGQMQLVALAPESGTSGVLSMRHVNLVRFSDDLLTIVPNVAKSWEWNDDFTEITFFLREGHRWSDGEPFTADDILFWWEDIQLNEDLMPEVPSTWIFGDEPMNMEKIDDYTLKISLAVPSPAILIVFATTYIQPFQPKHFLSQFHIDYNPDANDLAEVDGYANWLELFRSYYHDWKDSYHRLGVPTLESHVMVEETTEYRFYVANPYYFKVDTAGQQLPYINEMYESFIPDKEVIDLKIIAGEVDLKAQSLDLLSYPLFKENEANGNYTVQLPPGGSETGSAFTFNETHKDPVLREIFSDVRFKQAMSLAINRDEINEVVYLGLARPMQGVPADPSVSFTEPWMYDYMIEYDPDRANELLDEMGLTGKDADGFRLRPDGERLTVYFVYCQQAAPVPANELVKEYWEAVGVRVELKEQSTEAYRVLTADNEHDISMWGLDSVTEPALLNNPYTLRPPFGEPALSSRTGAPWYHWWVTGGAEGEEPPDQVKQLFGLVDQWRSALPGSDEYLRLGKEIVQIHLDNLWLILTVGDVPAPTIVHNRLGNVPEYPIQIWDYYRHYPFQPYQFYIKE